MFAERCNFSVLTTVSATGLTLATLSFIDSDSTATAELLINKSVHVMAANVPVKKVFFA